MPIPDAEFEAVFGAPAPQDPNMPAVPMSGVTDADLDALVSAPPPPPPDEGFPLEQPQIPGYLQAPEPELPAPPQMSEQEQVVAAAEAGDPQAQAALQAEAAANAPQPAEIRPPELVGEPGGSTAVVTAAPEQYNIDGRAALSSLPPDQLFAAIDAMDPDQRGELIASLSPDARAAWIAHDNARREDYANIRMEEEVRQAESQQAEMAAKSLELRTKADQMITQIMHDAETMQTEVIDKRSGFMIAMQGIAAGWGNVMALRSGGPNHVAQQIQQGIESDIQSQRISINNGIRSLENRRGIVNKLYEQSGDIDQAVHTARILMYKQAQEKVAQEMHKYDPDNTRARAHAQSIMALRAKEAEAAAAAREATSKRAERAHKAWVENRKLELEAERVRKMKDHSGGGGGGGGGEGLNAVDTPDGTDSIDKLLRRFGVDTSTVKAGDIRDSRIRSRAFKMPNDRWAYMQGLDPETQKNTVNGLKEAMSLTSKIRRLVGLVEAKGWQPSLARGGTAAGTEMASLYADISVQYKGPAFAALGVLAGEDLNLINSVMGGDPTKVQWRNVAKNLRSVNKRIIDKTNRELDLIGTEYAPGKPVKWNPPFPDKSKLRRPKINDAFATAERMIADYEKDGASIDDVNGSMIAIRNLFRNDRGTTSKQRARFKTILDTYEKKIPVEDRKRWVDAFDEKIPDTSAAGEETMFSKPGNIVEGIDSGFADMEEDFKKGTDLHADMEKEFRHGTKTDKKIEKELGAAKAEDAAKRYGKDAHFLLSPRSRRLRAKYEKKRKQFEPGFKGYTDAEWFKYMRDVEPKGGRPPGISRR